MSSPGIFLSDNEDYNKILTDEQLRIQDPQTRDFADIKFKKIASSHHKYLQPSNAFYNFDNNTLNNVANPNYNTNTPEENHMSAQAFSLQEEINLSSMKSILDITKFKYATYTIKAPSVINTFQKSNKLSSSIIAHHLLFQINKRLLELGYSSNKHPFIFFNIDTLQELPSTTSNNLITMMRISRPHKIYNFTIEFSVSFELLEQQSSTTLSSTSLSSTLSPSTTSPIIKVKYDYITLKGINSDYKFDKYKKDKISAQHSTLTNTFNPDLDYNTEIEKVNDIIRENKKAYTRDPKYHSMYYENIMMYPNSGCFIKNRTNTITKLETENPIKCQSYWPEYGYNGVWDTKCQSNSDCPFYSEKYNTGKCDTMNGICEMPVGVTRIGYKQYLKDSKAKCAECPLDNPYCCYSSNKSSSDIEYKYI
jgi:hypothetical protein